MSSATAETDEMERELTLAEMREWANEIEQWKTRGESLFAKRGWSMMFRLGVWWGERPWYGSGRAA